MAEILPEDTEEGARQSALRAGYRTGFEAADKVHEATGKGDKAGEQKDAKDDKQDAAPEGKDKFVRLRISVARKQARVLVCLWPVAADGPLFRLLESERTLDPFNKSLDLAIRQSKCDRKILIYAKLRRSGFVKRKRQQSGFDPPRQHAAVVSCTRLRA